MSWPCQLVCGEYVSKEPLTVCYKADEEKHSGFQRNDVNKKMPLIICPNTSVNPRAMALRGQHAT